MAADHPFFGKHNLPCVGCQKPEGKCEEGFDGLEGAAYSQPYSGAGRRVSDTLNGKISATGDPHVQGERWRPRF